MAAPVRYDARSDSRNATTYGRLLRPLLTADHPPAAPELRQALRVIDTHVLTSIHRARLPTAA